MKYAAYCGTRNLYPDMEMSAKSIVANSDVDKVFFFIEDDEFPSELPPIVETRNVGQQTIFPRNNANRRSRFTYMAMMRAALCKLLDVDKVLSLDCDTVAMRDCSSVWDIDISNSYFAATPEKWAKKMRPGLTYCNIGVALLNLDKLRDGKADEIINVLNTHYFKWVDQDAYNYLCQGRITEIDSAFNSCPWTVEGSKPIIVHYAARDDWRDEPEAVKYRNMSWSRAMELHDDFLARIADLPR